MTLQDLVELHKRTKAYCGEPWPANDRMAMRAVVEALRDEFDFDSNIYDQFNEILASVAVGGDEAAGDGKAASSDVVGQRTPEAPAADVCIWDSYYAGYTRATPYKTGCGNVTRVSTVDENCHYCGKPISFKEAP
jgi:hypothetical protein